MKKKINCSWPAKLMDFSQDSKQENFSRGKLKVFYKGETEDKRYFSDEFAKVLIETLPYTPVVSYYNEEEEDFVGHASEQNIYGIVDPCSEISFEKDEDNKEWCVCEVVLYTERPDRVGDIAKKIVGHKHSLELDPRSVEYVINYDERKHLKNIEFTAGKFVGVSVLGEKQKPAFAGSEFFAKNEQFESKMKILRDYCEHGKEQDQGGPTMNLSDFIKLTWGDKCEAVAKAIESEYGNEYYTYVVDMYDDSAIIRMYSYLDGNQTLVRIGYSMTENGEVTLGDVNEVRMTYVDVEKPNTDNDVDTATESEVFENEEPVAEVAEEVTEATEEKFEENIEDVVVNAEETPVEETTVEITEEENTAEQVVEETPTEEVFEASESNAEIVTPDSMEASVEEHETNQSEENSSSAAFAEREQEELENLRREKKIALVDSYKDNLTDEEYDSFMANIDSFESLEVLELQLLKAYKKNASEVKPMRAFSMFTPKQTSDNELNSYMNRLLNR